MWVARCACARDGGGGGGSGRGVSEDACRVCLRTCLIWQVHVDDILEATRRCLDAPRPSERINVGGLDFALSELISYCKHPSVPDGPDTDMSSKCVCSDRLLEEVMPEGFNFVPAIPPASPPPAA